MSIGRLATESGVLAQRQLIHVRQIPEKLMDVTLQPIMFVLLFAYVFGSVIPISDGSYRAYLIGGILVQSIGFGIMGPATSLATDIQGGIVDRLRTLPISRASYLIGHLIAELMAMALMIAILCGTGLVVGWRITSDVPHALAGFALLLLLATTMLWVGTLLGIIVRSPDAAQGVVFMTVFPLTFLATTFVPADGLDGVVGEIAAWNPFSAFSAAIRTLFGNPTATPVDAAWPLVHPVVASLLWCGVILVLVVPLALSRFKARTTG
jgi:ABC-type polysaccharide/polyol phosphate export permease